MPILHGFELLKDEQIPELNTRARLYRHVKTGAQLLSLENDDENKVFGITFRTPPADSTGVPHIMEHAVLCGSRKYPVKEPFVELLKGSLKTFLNAFTYPDKTCYPVASQNQKDFYNLVDVYLDAVFYPLIPPHTFQQEGWHYELERPDEPLRYKGVVFNEMKGAYSSPDSLLAEYSQQALFPDTPYRFDSGGDPKVIPSLTYEQFKAFHDTYYHPSNARLFFYGDDDPETRLRLVNEYLKDFDPLPVQSAVPLQAPFTEPRRVVRTYAADLAEEGNKGMLTVNWLLPETTDTQTTMALGILSYILVGTPASPLRKALIDSGLGEDLTGGGMAAHLRQAFFSTGLKGMNPADAGRVETLILDTLAELAEQGIDPGMVEAALNTAEFRLREQNTGSFPRGLALMLAALTNWLHDADPIEPLAFEKPLAAIKEAAQDPAFFPQLIRRHFLDNPHRVTVLLNPDPEQRQREEAEEAARLEAARAAMRPEDLQAIIENTRRLKRLQETPDPPEALATIPHLQLSDLDRQNKPIPLAVLEADGVPLLYHNLFTNGIIYLDVGFDLHTLPQELLPYVPLFSQALLEIGTEKEDFVKLSQRIGRKTGGIWTSSYTSAMREKPDESAAWLFVRGKATPEHADDLLDILRDILLTVKLDNPERFRQMVLEDKAGHESGLIPGGHGVVGSRLRAHFTESGWLDEEMGGVSNLFFVRRLAQQVEEDWPAVLEKLEAIRRTLINRRAMLCNITLDEANWATFQPKLAAFLTDLPAAPVKRAVGKPASLPPHEGLTVPAQVNFVGKGANLYRLGYRLHGSVSVITNFLRTSWLWERVRVQGGAYGGFCTFDQHAGVFAYLSYRDPNLLETLSVYDRTADFLREVELGESELTKSIIGAISTMDAYRLPDAKGYISMLRYLIGYTDEARQQFREEVLGTTAAHFRAFAEVLEAVRKEGLVVVMGSAEAIEAANAERGDWLQVQKVL
ncbi:MAG: peptidase M16 [Caldilineae bacterium]|nr:MAG: peptidase M16 [Caldilineae bacterium]